MRDVRTAEWVSLLLGRIRTEKIIAIDVRLPTEFILDEYSGAAGIAAVQLAAPPAVCGARFCAAGAQCASATRPMASIGAGTDPHLRQDAAHLC
jgi:hypothetical protein